MHAVSSSLAQAFSDSNMPAICTHRSVTLAPSVVANREEGHRNVYRHFEVAFAMQKINALAPHCFAIVAFGIAASTFDLMGATGGASAHPTLAILKRL